MESKLIRMTTDLGNVFINVRPADVKEKEAMGWKRVQAEAPKEPKAKAPKEPKDKA